MRYLTERQRDILNFIRDFQQKRGVAPTHREICDHFGFSSYGTVYKHLSLLEKKGLIRRDWNQKRGVEVVEDEKPAPIVRQPEPSGVRDLPLFGYIAAGRPLDVERSDETIPVPEHLTTRGENYVLKVRGVGHSRQARELDFGRAGIRLLAPARAGASARPRRAGSKRARK